MTCSTRSADFVEDSVVEPNKCFSAYLFDHANACTEFFVTHVILIRIAAMRKIVDIVGNGKHVVT